MGHQQKAPVQPPEVVGHQRPSRAVQVVGRLVDHGVGPLVQKEGGQQGSGLLPAAEGGEGPVQQLLPQPQLGQLPDQPPLLLRRHTLKQQVQRPPGRVGHRSGPAPAGLTQRDNPLPLQLPGQQTEQGGLAPAIAAHQPQLPVGVQLEVQPLKDGGVVPVVGKIQILYRNLRHIVSSCHVREKAARGTFLSRRQGHNTPIGSRKGKTARFLLRTHDRAGLFSQPCILSCHGISKWFCASSRLPSV